MTSCWPQPWSLPSLSSEGKVKAWLDGIVTICAQRFDISLSSSGAGGGEAVINNGEFLKFQSEQDIRWSVGRPLHALPHASRPSTENLLPLFQFLNHADPGPLTYMQYHMDCCDTTRGDTYVLARQFGQELINNTREVIEQLLIYKEGMLLFLYFDVPNLFSSYLPYYSAHQSYCEGGHRVYGSHV